MLATMLLESTARRRPITTLFLLQSLDGKISTGSVDARDVDKDFPTITGVKEGLQQYYDIEMTTDLWSLCSGRVQAKVGANTKPIVNNPDAVVSFAIIDNKHLTEHGVRVLCGKTKKTVILTTNKNHPAFKLLSELGNLQVMLFDNLDNPNKMFERLYAEQGCDRITVQTGGTLNSLFLRAGCIDYIDIVIAPILIGGSDTTSLVEGKSLNSVSDLNKMSVLKLQSIEKLKYSYIRTKYKVVH